MQHPPSSRFLLSVTRPVPPYEFFVLVNDTIALPQQHGLNFVPPRSYEILIHCISIIGPYLKMGLLTDIINQGKVVLE